MTPPPTDGFTCSRCGGMADTLIDSDPDTGRTRVRFRCGDCGLTANSARVGSLPPLAAGEGGSA